MPKHSFPTFRTFIRFVSVALLAGAVLPFHAVAQNDADNAADQPESQRDAAQPPSAPPAEPDAAQEPATQQPVTQEPAPVPNGQEPPPELMELQELLQQPAVAPALQQEVTTVSRQESTVGKSPAAVFVITNDMIRRSGATTIAETLRMVPGLNVSRIDNANWAIGSRGFADRFAGKMLVQIDGRKVYDPLVSGVFWQAQDLLLQDVERIEVIRGPGATVWGANAMNGIINVITKSAKDTQGGMIVAGGGTEERGFSGFRYGAEADDVYYRVWGKWREVDRGFNAAGESHEDWREGRGGFRIDWDATDDDMFTLQGDLFGNKEGLLDRLIPTPIAPFRFNRIEDRNLSGGDVLGRWTHTIDEDSDWALQLYYDNFKLEQIRFDRYEHNTFDLDFQHQFPLGSRQQLIWGFGYRRDRMHLGQGPDVDGFEVRAFPPERDLNLFSAFVQDTITLVDDRWYFTVGSKFENNEFTGFEYQPTGRLLWTPTQQQSVWASMSRAVRTPNFGEIHSRNMISPTPPSTVFPVVTPSPGFESEELLAYELGLRSQPSDAFSWDLALFFNDYTRLRTLVPGTLAPEFATGLPPLSFFPLEFQNRMVGETYGVELAANYQLTECWKLYGAYTFLQMQLHADPSLPTSTRHSAGSEGIEEQNPQNQVYLQSSWDLACNWEFDLIGRYVDRLGGFRQGPPPTFSQIPQVDSYIEMDIRLGWKPRQNLELSVVGQNLLDSHHLEFGGNPLVGRPVVEAERGVYGMIEWAF